MKQTISIRLGDRSSEFVDGYVFGIWAATPGRYLSDDCNGYEVTHTPTVTRIAGFGCDMEEGDAVAIARLLHERIPQIIGAKLVIHDSRMVAVAAPGCEDDIQDMARIIEATFAEVLGR